MAQESLISILWLPISYSPASSSKGEVSMWAENKWSPSFSDRSRGPLIVWSGFLKEAQLPDAVIIISQNSQTSQGYYLNNTQR